jgi:hypothetical protein
LSITPTSVVELTCPIPLQSDTVLPSQFPLLDLLLQFAYYFRIH